MYQSPVPQNINDMSNTEVVKGEILNDKELVRQTNSGLDEIQSLIGNYWHTQQQLENIQYHERNKQILLQQQRQSYINDIYNMQNQLLGILNASGTCLWQNNKRNKICYRVNINEEIQEGSKKTISTLLSKVYSRRIKIVDDIDDIKVDPIIDNITYIFTSNIDILHDERFNPYTDLEFFQVTNTWYRNLFSYSPYLLKRLKRITNSYNPFDIAYSSVFTEYNGSSSYKVNNLGILESSSLESKFTHNQLTFSHPSFKIFDRFKSELEERKSTIKNFIFVLANENIHKYNYIMNWLAYFFQNLNKSKVALVLLGDEEVIEDIFWNKIVLPTFGSKFCTKIDDETLSERLDIELIENKIFVNFSGFSTKYNKRMEKLLEKVLLDSFLDQNDETQIYTQALVTSNSPYELVKNAYSKCTVIEVNNLKNIKQKLDIPDLISLKEMIKNNLDDFCNILAQYPVHKDFANYALDTKERSFLTENKNNSLIEDDTLDIKIDEFITAIKNMNIDYFKKVKDVDPKLYAELEDSFSNEMIPSPSLNFYFNTVYGEEIFTKERKILDILKEKEELFNQKINTEKAEDGTVIFQGNKTSKLNKKQFKIKNYTLKISK